ncbi:hypothetical protein [Herpetosiphon geysericola]|uniref:Integral membrane protein n=1 Tax=Herpetosiphon geysericola TaxID=70996 RepID=A0A0P6YP23_9CHLR|nr:hypothetical protein [Herpetosiphon geysericola]KPL92038.1 integral membrane protein [Herpetosiphon geysericola]
MARTDQTTESEVLAGSSRVLRFAYCVLAISAGARALFQVATKFNQAPLAYGLTTIAALIYGIAFLGFGRRTPQAWRVTMAVCAIEFLGVITVGILTLIERDWFPKDTVWSDFGIGYGFTPLLLPIAGLWLLLRQETREAYGVANKS